MSEPLTGDRLKAALVASLEMETGKPYVPPPKPLYDWTEAEWQAACPVEPRPLDKPRPGYFRLRVAARGPWCAARIWSYRPRVAGTDHLMGHVGGVCCDELYVWQHGREITRELYEQLMAQPSSEPMRPVVHRRKPKDMAA